MLHRATLSTLSHATCFYMQGISSGAQSTTDFLKTGERKRLVGRERGSYSLKVTNSDRRTRSQFQCWKMYDQILLLSNIYIFFKCLYVKFIHSKSSSKSSV